MDMNSVLDRLFNYGFSTRQCQAIAAFKPDFIGIPLVADHSGITSKSGKLPVPDDIVVTEEDGGTNIQDNLGHHVMRVDDIVYNEKRAHKCSVTSRHSKDKEVLVTNTVKVKVELPNESQNSMTESAPSTCTVSLENNSTFGNIVTCIKSEPKSSVVSNDVLGNGASKLKHNNCRKNTAVLNIKTEGEQEQENDEFFSTSSKPYIEHSNDIETVDESNQKCCISVDGKEIPEPFTNDVPIRVDIAKSVDQDKVLDSCFSVQNHSVIKDNKGVLNDSSTQAEIYLDVDLDGMNNGVNDNIAIEDIQDGIHISAVTETHDHPDLDLDVSDKLYLSFASEESSDSFLEEPVKFLKPEIDLKRSGEFKSDNASRKMQQLINKPNININGSECISLAHYSEQYAKRFQLKKAMVILRRCDADLGRLNLELLKTKSDKDTELPYTHPSRNNSTGIQIDTNIAKVKHNRKGDLKNTENMDTNNNVKVCSVKKFKNLDKSEEHNIQESSKSKTSDKIKRAEEVKADKSIPTKGNVRNNYQDAGHSFSERTNDKNTFRNSDKAQNKGYIEQSRANVTLKEKSDTKNTEKSNATITKKGLQVDEDNKHLRETEENTKLTKKIQRVSKDSLNELNCEVRIKPKKADVRHSDKPACVNDKDNVNGNCKERTRDNCKDDCLKQQCTNVESKKHSDRKKHSSLKEESTTKEGNVACKKNKTNKHKHAQKTNTSQNRTNCAKQQHIDSGHGLGKCENKSDTLNSSHCSKTHKRRHRSDDYELTHRKHKKRKRTSDEINKNKIELKISNESNGVNNKPVVVCNESKTSEPETLNQNVLNSETSDRIWDWLATGDELAHDEPLHLKINMKKKPLQNKLNFKIPKKDKELEKDKSDLNIDPKKVNIKKADGKIPKKSDKKHNSHKKIKKGSKAETVKTKDHHSNIWSVHVRKNNEIENTANAIGVKCSVKKKETKALEEGNTKQSKQNRTYIQCESNDTSSFGPLQKITNTASVEKIRKRHRHESEENAMNKKAKHSNEDLQRMTFDNSADKVKAVTVNSNGNHNKVDIFGERKFRNIEHSSAIHDIGKTKTGISEPCVTNSSIGTDKDVKNNTLVQSKEFDIHMDQIKGEVSADMNNNEKHDSNCNHKLNKSVVVCLRQEQTAEKSIEGVRENKTNYVKDNGFKSEQKSETNTHQRLKMCTICECVLFKHSEDLKLHEAKCKPLETHDLNTNGNNKTKSDEVNEAPVEKIARDSQTSKKNPVRYVTVKECKNGTRNMNISGTHTKESIIYDKVNKNNTGKDKEIKSEKKAETNTHQRLKMCTICESVLFQSSEDLKLHEAKCKPFDTEREDLKLVNGLNSKSKVIEAPVRDKNFARDIQTLQENPVKSVTTKECKNDTRNRNISGTSVKENIKELAKVTDEKEQTQMNKQNGTDYSSKGNTFTGKKKMIKCENCKIAWYTNLFDLKCHQNKCSPLNITQVANEKKQTQINRQMSTNYSSKGTTFTGKNEMIMCENCKKAWFNNMFDLKCHQKNCSPINITQVRNRETVWVRNKNTTVVSKVVKEMGQEKSTSTNFGDTRHNGHPVKSTSTNFGDSRQNGHPVKSTSTNFGDSRQNGHPEKYTSTKFGDTRKNRCGVSTFPRVEMCRICKGAYFRSKVQLMNHVRVCRRTFRFNKTNTRRSQNT